MKPLRAVALAVAVLISACMGEPGGGGVNIPGSTVPTPSSGPTTSVPSTTSTSVPSTTSTSVPSTTSTSVPSTTSTSAPPTTTTTTPTLRISGRVFQHDGRPSVKARVGMGETRVTTGPRGWFSLTVTEPGPLVVTKRGWARVETPWEGPGARYRVTIAPKTIRGLRVAGEAAASDAHFRELLRLADETAVNALVFDTKRESGEVLYETKVEGAHVDGAVNAVYEPRARIAQAREHGLYTVTRVAAFEDDIRSSARPGERLAGTWLRPDSASARKYLIALAVEACRLGFDEIQFDYVRYPAGRTAEVSGQRDLTQEQRLEVISSFLAEAGAALHPRGCAVSAAIFGIVVSMPDDQGLGQRPEELSPHVDALSPMVYPSHYADGWLGFDTPNDHPYAVTADALRDAAPRMREGAVLRPYLQAFWWTSGQIRESIQAAEDAGAGWILWNIVSDYDRAALPTDDELRGRATR